jgi:hypothetical protein
MVERLSYPCLIECLFIEHNEGSTIIFFLIFFIHEY